MNTIQSLLRPHQDHPLAHLNLSVTLYHSLNWQKRHSDQEVQNCLMKLLYQKEEKEEKHAKEDGILGKQDDHGDKIEL